MKNNLQIFKTFCITALLIAIAVFCRYAVIRNGGVAPFEDKLFNYIRVFIYIGMFSVWGVAASRRVMQKPVRLLLITTSVLMVFWLVLREFRFRYVINPDLLRFLWYLYYIPIMIIPLFAIYISLFIGKSEDWKMPKVLWLFCVPTAALLALVLTNDLHQFAFVFSYNGEPWSDKDYSYGWLFYTVTGWEYFCSAFAFSVMIKKLRKPTKTTLLPLLPLALAVTYGILYAARIPFVIKYLGDLTVVFCLAFTAFFESCIEGGLIQSNSRYSSLFTASVNTPIQILDSDFNICYAASASEKFEKSDVINALKNPVILNGKKRLHAISIKGGYAVWSEDISKLIRLKEALTERKEELAERGAFLKLEYEKEKQHKTVEEQNRLYDLLHNKTQTQLEKLDLLVDQYKAAHNYKEKQNILAHIVIIGTFIKRRKDFTLSMESDELLPEAMLESALAESFKALGLLGIKGSYYVNTNKKYISGETLLLTYDFFEDVMETVLDKAKYINLRFCYVRGTLRISILASCEGSFDLLKEKYPNIIILPDDGTEFIIEPEGGMKND